MTNSPTSCAVAFPSQRNCATSEKSATPTATEYHPIKRKPASIQELRAQLLAQQERNKAATVQASEPPKVAHEIAPVAPVALLRPLENEEMQLATPLVREFMESDGLSPEQAHALAAASVWPRPPAEWLALIQELDALIDRYCQACFLSDDARDRIRELRKRRSLASIPLAVDWFRRELGQIG
jgi:hypothetical protein